jgi:hypothetical protein
MDCANRKFQLAGQESHSTALLAGEGSNGDLEIVSIILELPCMALTMLWLKQNVVAPLDNDIRVIFRMVT